MLIKATRFIQRFSKPLNILGLRRFRIIAEIIGVVASVYVIAIFIPKNLFNSLPATGGDTGSHFWPVKVLHDYGIPNLIARPWNPGNNGGEGLLVHYFPLPFIFMALLGYLIPIGMAFNIGTLIPVVTLPLSVWAGLRLMSLRFPGPVLAAVIASGVILNEGNSMWGGNTLSTLAGQFSHMYALNFLFLGCGVLWSEINRKKIPWKSSVLFSAVAISHGYIYFGVPLLILLIALLHPKNTFRFRLSLCFLSAVFSFTLSAWFVGPMIITNAWVTPHFFLWAFQDWTQELMPRIWDPIIFLFFACVIALSYRNFQRRDNLLIRVSLFWFGSGLVYLGFFFLFRALHLVDVRAIPQIHLFWGITIGILIALVFRPLQKGLILILTTMIVAFLIPWETSQVVKFPIWMEWNYSGWETKNNYHSLLRLSNALRGELSDPRVAYEHHVKNNFVGTERVFEMLPYFANRATTESLYLQSTVLAPMIYSLTSEISENSSCPFANWPCMHFGLIQAQDRLSLLGVNQIILSSARSIKAATESSFLKSKFTFAPWTVFESIDPVHMTETFITRPVSISFKGWRVKFWDWFKTYQKGSPFLVTSQQKDNLPKENQWTTKQDCHPTTSVDFSGIYFHTDCPGVAHFLKYAYHPSFTSSGGEPLFLVSPGYLGIVPTTTDLKLTFGSSWTWSFFKWVSLLFVFIGSIIIFLQSRGFSNGVFLGFQKLNEKLQQVAQKPATKNRLKKRSGQITIKKTKHRIPLFYPVSGVILCFYLVIVFRTDSFLFWRWRQLNFRDFEILSDHQDYGTLHKNEGVDGKPIIVKGVIYTSGLGTHANSEIKIRVKNNSPFLSGKCGYPDYASGANVQCEIRGNSRILFKSTALNNDHREEPFRVSLEGEKDIILAFRTLNPNINSAHGVWVDLLTRD